MGLERSDEGSCLYTLHSTPYTKYSGLAAKATFDILIYLDFTLFRRTFCEISHFLGGLFVKYHTF